MLKFSMEFQYPMPIPDSLSVGTLGPSGTSSENTLNYLSHQLAQAGMSSSSCLFDNFTVLKDALTNKQIDLALVPHAYSKVNEFYMDSNLMLSFIFTYPTPLYGLARKKKHAVSNLKTCRVATHPAPLPLLPRLLPTSICKSNVRVALTESTSAAASEVQRDRADLAITNEKAVKMYGLEFLSETEEIFMSWSVFCRRTNQQ